MTFADDVAALRQNLLEARRSVPRRWWPPDIYVRRRIDKALAALDGLERLIASAQEESIANYFKDEV